MMSRSQSARTPRASLSHWSRHDPVMQQAGCNDHWSRLRVRYRGNADVFAKCTHVTNRIETPQNAKQYKDPVKEDYNNRMKMLLANGDGRVDPKGQGIFAQVPGNDLHGNIPGNYTVVRPKTTPVSITRTSFNNRAKEGFKYWYQERPKPTSFGRYGIGSYKTVLGLGNGPRT